MATLLQSHICPAYIQAFHFQYLKQIYNFIYAGSHMIQVYESIFFCCRYLESAKSLTPTNNWTPGILCFKMAPSDLVSKQRRKIWEHISEFFFLQGMFHHKTNMICFIGAKGEFDSLLKQLCRFFLGTSWEVPKLEAAARGYFSWNFHARDSLRIFPPLEKQNKAKIQKRGMEIQSNSAAGIDMFNGPVLFFL